MLETISELSAAIGMLFGVGFVEGGGGGDALDGFDAIIGLGDCTEGAGLLVESGGEGLVGMAFEVGDEDEEATVLGGFLGDFTKSSAGWAAFADTSRTFSSIFELSGVTIVDGVPLGAFAGRD